MKKNSNMNEQTLKVLAYSVAIAVMIVLLAGDMIVSGLMHGNSNQEGVEQREVDTKLKEDASIPSVSSGGDYDIQFMNQISLQETYEKIVNKETVFVLSGRSTCGPCKQFVPILKGVYSELNITDGIYFDQNLINSETTGYQEFISLSNTISENFGGTPFFMIFQDGKLVDSILGMNPTIDLKVELINKIQNVK